LLASALFAFPIASTIASHNQKEVVRYINNVA